MKSKLTKQDVFEKLQEIDRKMSLQTSDITIDEVRKELKCGRDNAERYLDELVKNKVVERLDLLTSTGKKRVVWRPL